VTPKHSLNTRSSWLWIEILFEESKSPRVWKLSKQIKSHYTYYKIIAGTQVFPKRKKEGRYCWQSLPYDPSLPRTSQTHLHMFFFFHAPLPRVILHADGIVTRQKMCDSYCTWLTSNLASCTVIQSRLLPLMKVFVNPLPHNDVYICIYISAPLISRRFKYLFNKYPYWIF
jgi:hypothetical protein